MENGNQFTYVHSIGRSEWKSDEENLEEAELKTTKGLWHRYVALWARSWLGLALNLFLQMSLVSAPQNRVAVRRHVRTAGYSWDARPGGRSEAL